MTDKSKTEELADADLDDVQGGKGTSGPKRVQDKAPVKPVGGKGIILAEEMESI